MLVKYPREVATKVVHTGAQQDLVDHGLPDQHLLFTIYTPSDTALRRLPGGREVLVIGDDRKALDLCIDVHSGAVIEVNRSDGSVWLVNSSVRQFVRCLEEFSRRYPFGESSNDLDNAEAAADELASTIREIDDAAIDTERGYWGSIIFDIGNGDYAAS
jgi:hypothetical protein